MTSFFEQVYRYRRYDVSPCRSTLFWRSRQRKKVFISITSQNP